MFFNQWKSYNIDQYLMNNEVQIKSMDLISPILIKKFDNFLDIKEKTISLIDQTKKSNSEVDSEAHVNISKSDYNFSNDADREWLKYIGEHLTQNIYLLSRVMGYDSINISSSWFQQYQTESFHGWHIHSHNHYSGVFYLEMPEGGPQTQFFNTINKSIYSLDMTEGDIAIFPSYFPHRSGPNKSIQRKTIVSFNFNFGIPDYQQDTLDKLAGG